MFEFLTLNCFNGVVKKENKETTSLNLENISNDKFESEGIKTTNVNILLNRVRLDKKRTLKKKIVFSLFYAAIISSIIIYFII